MDAPLLDDEERLLLLLEGRHGVLFTLGFDRRHVVVFLLVGFAEVRK